jgi:hypothetical protein
MALVHVSGIGVWIQGLLSHNPSPFISVFLFFSFFKIGSQVFSWLTLDWDPPTSATEFLGLQSCTTFPGFQGFNIREIIQECKCYRIRGKSIAWCIQNLFKSLSLCLKFCHNWWHWAPDTAYLCESALTGQSRWLDVHIYTSVLTWSHYHVSRWTCSL